MLKEGSALGCSFGKRDGWGRDEEYEYPMRSAILLVYVLEKNGTFGDLMEGWDFRRSIDGDQARILAQVLYNAIAMVHASDVAMFLLPNWITLCTEHAIQIL